MRLNILRGKGELESVFIETAGVCTNRCYMCPSRLSETKRGFMSDKIFEKSINELATHEFNGSLHFYGQGEPLLDKKIFERIKYARKKLPNAIFDVISNFVLLDAEKRKKLIEAPIDTLTNSCYGLKSETYKKICGRNNFERALKNLIEFSIAWSKTQPYKFSIIYMDDISNKYDKDFARYFIGLIPASVCVFNPTISVRGLLPRKNGWENAYAGNTVIESATA